MIPEDEARGCLAIVALGTCLSICLVCFFVMVLLLR